MTKMAVLGRGSMRDKQKVRIRLTHFAQIGPKTSSQSSEMQ